MNVALVTSSEFRELDADTRLLIAPLEARGVSVTPAVWDDPGVHWAGFDLAVIRSCWDYVPRRGEFVAWASRVKRQANPAEVIAWNTDKRYLADLADGGVPVVPTTWVNLIGGLGWPGGRGAPVTGKFDFTSSYWYRTDQLSNRCSPKRIGNRRKGSG